LPKRSKYGRKLRRFQPAPVSWLNVLDSASTGQALREAGEPPGRLDGIYGNGESLRLADDHHQALTAGDGSIQEIAFEHRVVLGGQGHDHGRELRALALVERLGMRSATDSMSLSWIASGKEAGRK